MDFTRTNITLTTLNTMERMVNELTAQVRKQSEGTGPITFGSSK